MRRGVNFKKLNTLILIIFLIGVITGSSATVLITISINNNLPQKQLQPTACIIQEELALEKEEIIEIEESENLISLGDYRITAYCSCKQCCGKWANDRPKDEFGNDVVYGANNTVLISGVSVAAELDFGTLLKIPDIDNDKIFEVQDRAAKHISNKYNGKYIDIYFNDHKTCWSYILGKPEYAEVFIYE